MQWDVEPTGARIAQLASDLTARIEALDPESDTPVYADFSFAIAVADWTLANGVYTARVNNTVLLTENAGIQVFYDASLRNYLVGDIFADKHTGYIDFTTTHLPVGSISGIVRVLDSVSGNLSVSRGGTGAATPKQARVNLNVPIRDIPIDFGTVSSLPQTIYDADITANMVAFDAVFGNPAAVPSGIDVTFASGSVTISGTMTSGQSTTIKFWAHEQRSAVEGTESGSAEPRVNDFVHVGAQTLTTAQQTQIRQNLGAASASDISTLNNIIGGIKYYSFTQSSADQNDQPWLVLKEQYANILDGICIGKINCAGIRGFWGYKQGNYASFIVQMYSHLVQTYRVVNVNGTWRYTPITEGSFTTF